jgi:aryl-alcohol dehydrogenase-like predicted oxidoreductase
MIQLIRTAVEQGVANRVLADGIGELAARHKVSSAQLALAWVLAQKPGIVPIPGTTNVHRLEENIAAASIELTPDDLGGIESAISGIAVVGARYPDWMQETVGR